MAWVRVPLCSLMFLIFFGGLVGGLGLGELFFIKWRYGWMPRYITIHYMITTDEWLPVTKLHDYKGKRIARINPGGCYIPYTLLDDKPHPNSNTFTISIQTSPKPYPQPKLHSYPSSASSSMYDLPGSRQVVHLVFLQQVVRLR